MLRFLIVETCGNILSNPTTLAIIDELIRRKYEVDIITVKGTLSPQEMPSRWRERVSVRDFHLAFGAEHPWQGWRQSIVSQTKRLIQNFRAGRLVDPLTIERRQANRYQCILGIDPTGIIAADCINAIARRPLVYISFELLLKHELESDSEWSLKRREASAIRGVNTFLIQDELRRDLFCRDNSVPHDQCVLVPVAPADQYTMKTRYLHDKLNIPLSRRIVLYQGSLSSWGGRDDLEEMVSYWPDDVVLVVHSRFPVGSRMRRYLEGSASDRRILITDHPVSAAELPTLTASADIGLAPYRPGPDHWTHGDNLRFIGLASGKIAYYAMCGLPILARQTSSLTSLLEGNGIGFCYKRMSETGILIKRILDNREDLSRNSRNFYVNQLSPQRFIDSFCCKLERLQS